MEKLLWLKNNSIKANADKNNLLITKKEDKGSN